MVLAVPSRDGLEAARAAVPALLGWEEVHGQLEAHKVDPIQAERLRRRLVERGLIVAKLSRPDGSARTWWRGAVETEARDDPQLEVVLPDKAVEDAVHEAVERGTVWLTSGPTSVWKEPIPYGALGDDAVLHPKPDPIHVQELVADSLPGAWRDGKTNGIALAQALSQARGRPLPWGLVRESIKAGVESRWLAVAEGSVAVGCGYDEAGQLRLERPADVAGSDPPRPAPPVTSALLEGSQIQDLAELVPRLLETSAGNELRFRVSAVLKAGADEPVSKEVRAALDDLLATVTDDLKTE